MNIKITYHWILEFLETDANPDDIQKYLSLCGPSIERVMKLDNDYVFDIEIISNRIDTASVIGIAQEAQAILPQFGKKAKIKNNPLETLTFNQLEKKGDLPVKVEIKSADLCSRFSAIVIDNVKIQPSPLFIQKRLEAAGIKVINNVVDISNYLMLTFGQPVHTFDYDQIKKGQMIMRESKKGERIITLDENEITLPGGDIVIEDGEGRLIDLCGVMGGLNSAITAKTRRVLLFVQTYNKEKIRRTVMTTGVRTQAATYFEKGLDEERVEPTLVYGCQLLEKFAKGSVSSPVIDIFPHPYKKKIIRTTYDFFTQKIGIKIAKGVINKILSNLGFQVKEQNGVIEVKVPSYRKYDINIPEDLVEEVARIYGYNNLPNNFSPPALVIQSKDSEQLFTITDKIKYFLKHLGLCEVINYSMISESLIKEWQLDVKDYLRLTNTISKEIEYMRRSLLPSLYKNIKDNTGRKENLRLFEIAKVYYPKKDDLPDEVYHLGIAVNTDYFDIKGIIEALLKELNINHLDFKIIEKDGIYLNEISLSALIKNHRQLPVYQPINPYAIIKLDKTFELSYNLKYADIEKKTKSLKWLKKIEIVSLFYNKVTVRFYFQSDKKNITEEEAKKELEKI